MTFQCSLYGALSALRTTLFAICVLCLECQQPIWAQTISTKVLTSDTPTRIELNPAITTTLLFPAPIAGAFGVGLVSGQANTGGSVQLEHPEGSNVLILRAVNDNAKVLATVLLSGRLYVFTLVAGPSPDVAVTFVTAEESAPRAVAVTPEEIKNERPQYSAEALVGLLRRARDNVFLQQIDRAAYQGYSKREAKYTSDSGTYKTTVTDIHRFSKEDAVVLQGYVENETDQPLAFDGRAATVEVANEIFPVKILDCYRPIPAHGKTLIDCAIQGDIDGGRANLSIENEFRIILPVQESVWSLKSGSGNGKPFKIPAPVKQDGPMAQTGKAKRDTMQ